MIKHIGKDYEKECIYMCVCVYIYLNHFAVQQKLTIPQSKSTIPQRKKKTASLNNKRND